MGFTDAVRTVLSKYATFDGRASRAEYWWFVLFYFLVQLATGVIDGALFASGGFGVFALIAGIALFLPTIAVTTRRLHDTDRSGWWQLIAVLPLIGLVVLIVLCALRGSDGGNRFGPPTA